MLKHLFRPELGHRDNDEQALALNLSFVLHERSDSAAVRRAVRAVRHHSSNVDRLERTVTWQTIVRDANLPSVDFWITANIGVPNRLADALDVADDEIVSVDASAGSPQPASFFRALANLNLPADAPNRIGVAALILRPDHRTSQLIITGVHNWPDDRRGALRSLERLIQAHAGQWMPSRALWPAPAESLLPDEVY
jgi:hypothetical protein